MIEARVDLIEVQKYLGHHSILTTVRYTHLDRSPFDGHHVLPELTVGPKAGISILY